MQERIYLTITNPGQLLPDIIPRIDFDQSGGTIGSKGANWSLSDIKHRIAPIHCEIQWVEGSFCLIDRSGQTYLNNSTESLGISHIAQLNDGDIIGIGPYRILAYFNEIQNRLPDPRKSLEQHSLGELVNENRRQLTDHGIIGEDILMNKQHDEQNDQFKELSEQHKTDVDPLTALDELDKHTIELERKGQLIDPTHFGKSAQERTQANYIDTSVEAVSHYGGLSNTGNHIMEHTKHQIQQEWENAYNQEGDDARHLAIFPMQQGLQTNLGDLDSATAYNLMLEAGKALKAAISGLSQLYDEKYSASQNNLSFTNKKSATDRRQPIAFKATL